MYNSGTRLSETLVVVNCSRILLELNSSSNIPAALAYEVCISQLKRCSRDWCFTIPSFPQSWLILGFGTIVARWVPLFKQELLTLSEHLSSYRYSEVRVAKSVVCFVDFYIVCSSNYSFDIFIFFLSVNMINCDIRYLLYVTTCVLFSLYIY
jgi:hypothetical protein